MRVRVRVIACLQPGWWRVTVALHSGLADGGIQQDFAEEWIPVGARHPNGAFWIDGYEEGRPRNVSGPEVSAS